MEQEKEEYETVYFVTTPFANTEEEIATSFIIDSDQINEEHQIIVLSEDGSVILKKEISEKSSHDKDGENSLAEHEDNSNMESEESIIGIDKEASIAEPMAVIKEEENSNDEHQYTESKESSSSNNKNSIAENENSIMEEDNLNMESENSIMEDEDSMMGNENSVTKNSMVLNVRKTVTECGRNSVPQIVKVSSNNQNIAGNSNVAKTQIDDSSVENENSSVKPVDKNTCRYCSKSFTKVGNKIRHIRTVHKIKREPGNHIRCIECNTCYKHVQKLRDHLHQVHKLNMQEEELHFPNMIAFKKWKHDIERKELASFTLRHGARKTAQGLKYFYMCHRSGKYMSRIRGPRQRMLKNPGTCKLGIVCTAAIYAEDVGTGVMVKYCPHHYGHGKETSFVQLSTEEQTAIQENVSNGIPFESLLDDIRDSQSSTDHFQLSLLKKRDIRFINNAFNADEYNTGLSDAESVDRWVRMCCQMEESPILFYRQEEMADAEEEFMLVIMTEFQRHILMSAEKQVICVDSLYRRKGGRFYLTVIFIMDEYDIAFPVAYCISNKVDKSVMLQFFTSIKDSTGPLECTYFMSDSETFYYDSWTEVMGEEAKWIWSMWYVDNRIRVQLRIFRGNIMKRADVYKTMRQLLECQNKNVFKSMFKNYVDALMRDSQSKNLGNFILQKYGNNAEMWAYCYRKDIKLSTNIHLEVMHRTFRYCCREGRKKRLDKFLFVIMKLVRYKMLDRLTNVLDEEKIGLAIDAIQMFHGMGLEIPTDHISSLSNKIWLIQSEEEDETIYITREFDSCPEHCSLKCTECDICVHMFSCSCVHSMINANLCQHIHAVVWKFLTPHFSPPASPVADICEESEQTSNLIVPGNSSEFIDDVLKKTHDVYKKIRASKCTLSKESLSTIMRKLNECIDICSGKEPVIEEPAKNAVYIINPYVKSDNTQPLILPSNLPNILPNNNPLSQYVVVVPNKQ